MRLHKIVFKRELGWINLLLEWDVFAIVRIGNGKVRDETSKLRVEIGKVRVENRLVRDWRLKVQDEKIRKQ